ncbi:sulfate adenylyltransferase subunit CysD [Mesorhizobium sp. Z1-4]|uniref:sulfate adenylyltransferase subunit CysD n=1 Tax=Mesorhizobium sp. Z1-4 TaxID=2448478 RepID=UPI001FE0F066|nr:sulfate adenylyltransferase subunit CysD [Mesorhizobium sp. Z1-4]
MTATQTESRLSHLDGLEAEAIHILREGVAEGRNPVMRLSAGKDSTVLAHLAVRAFYPSPPLFPLLHVGAPWEFRSLLAFRDAFAERHGLELVVYANEAGRAAGLNPFEHGDTYTSAKRTDALKQALDRGGNDIVFGGARRDEEKSRAKERIFSVRNEHHGWELRQQRPELWRIFNTRLSKGQSLRVFPLSNWTETDIWTYALAPLYFAEPRPVIERDGALIVVDKPARLPLQPGENATTETVRFRTLGCWLVTAAIRSEARDLASVVRETLTAGASEREGRPSDRDGARSLERQKRKGYF